MSAGAPVRVLLAEDEPKLAFALRALLELDTKATVVGIVADGDDAVAAALRLRPEVIILDVRLEGADGIDAGLRIRDAWPDATIVVYSGAEEELTRARDAGFTDTLLKGAIVNELPAMVAQAYGRRRLDDA